MHKMRWFLMLGLLIMLICLYTACVSERSYDNLYQVHFEHYPNYITSTVRDNDQLTGPAGEALMAYEEKDFSGAVRLFQLEIPIQNADSLAHEMRFYWAISYMAMDSMEEAIEILSLLTSKENFRFSRQSKWYMALAQLKKGRIENAKTSFSKLMEENDMYGRKAGEVLEELDLNGLK